MLVLSSAGLALSLVVLPESVAPPILEMAPMVVVFAICSYGLLWAAVGTRERRRGGWRAGIGAYAVLVAVDLAGIGGGRRIGLSTVLMVLGLSTLLAPSTRQWFNTSADELQAIEAEERSIRRAQRRLSEDASLRNVSFRDLPRRDHP